MSISLAGSNTSGLTFDLFHRVTPGVPGHVRMRLFAALPMEAQTAAWRNLATTAQLAWNA